MQQLEGHRFKSYKQPLIKKCKTNSNDPAFLHNKDYISLIKLYKKIVLSVLYKRIVTTILFNKLNNTNIAKSIRSYINVLDI